MVKLTKILEQLIKKIPISNIEGLQKRLMQNNISLDELVEKVYKIKVMSLKSLDKYDSTKPMQIYNSNTGIDHVLYNLLLKAISQTNKTADVKTGLFLTIIYDLDSFKLTRIRHTPYDWPDDKDDYFSIQHK